VAVFRIRLNTQQQYYWVLQDNNFRTIAYSGESYVSKYNVERAITNVRGGVPGAHIVDDS
jgi:uncharacterized protein YegP (UPF0339 family)